MNYATEDFLNEAVIDLLEQKECVFTIYMMYHTNMQVLGLDPEKSEIMGSLKALIGFELSTRTLH